MNGNGWSSHRLKVPSKRNYSAPLFSWGEQAGERGKWSNLDKVHCHPFLTLAFTWRRPPWNRVCGFGGFFWTGNKSRYYAACCISFHYWIKDENQRVTSLKHVFLLWYSSAEPHLGNADPRPKWWWGSGLQRHNGQKKRDEQNVQWHCPTLRTRCAGK